MARQGSYAGIGGGGIGGAGRGWLIMSSGPCLNTSRHSDGCHVDGVAALQGSSWKQSGTKKILNGATLDVKMYEDAKLARKMTN